MELKFASYNIHKAVGLDRRRDPDRILSVLHEIDADVVALQECDRRFGQRESVLPRARIEDSAYRPITLGIRPGSLGWHGNTFLVKKHLDIIEAEPLSLPTLEPRGAVRLDIEHEGKRVRAVGMHLDLSGFRRREQAVALLKHLDACDGTCPTVVMGDTNEWSRTGGMLRVFRDDWNCAECGPSFPTRRPLARLDRIFASRDWHHADSGVHHSFLASRASDHLPVWASLVLR
ncbi:endonuclease/exonuclease/phosphatase family protein [Croceicoccus naphthovorans]|uniref:Endonuclease n=1 Tax=Croceicoccus naphthovorans TaxID=1348774 RepID=A0A0G3XM29_9SPHN|nr:endonuclease/exonuclease/phosphatase family protein [Croceicoccus naphthovorans]AKM11513.1 endonuclease [Croceicoccus naphthovorans]MBB3990164.1 endonuclease/exonuclease/phosphatase family metal-dependent hydrolase [Croceicoccus naphthovorans]